MFVKKYKFFTNPQGYQHYGYIARDFITNIFVGMAKKDIFEVRALVVGDSNAQILYYGSKKDCIDYMKKFAADDPMELLPEPEGVIDTVSEQE